VRVEHETIGEKPRNMRGKREEREGNAVMGLHGGFSLDTRECDIPECMLLSSGPTATSNSIDQDLGCYRPLLSCYSRSAMFLVRGTGRARHFAPRLSSGRCRDHNGPRRYTTNGHDKWTRQMDTQMDTTNHKWTKVVTRWNVP
jgi:hypothetical protein